MTPPSGDISSVYGCQRVIKPEIKRFRIPQEVSDPGPLPLYIGKSVAETRVFLGDDSALMRFPAMSCVNEIR
jgi:hypothetical protein